MARRTIKRSQKRLKDKHCLTVRRLLDKKYHTYIYDLNGLWSELERKVDDDKKTLYESGKLSKREYDEYIAVAELESGYLATKPKESTDTKMTSLVMP